MSTTSKSIHQLIERLGNLLRAEARLAGGESGMQPVQLEVLHFLANCNRYSDTLLSVAEYLGLTKGTTSQTIKFLVKNEYLVREMDATDHRVYHLKLTPKGRDLVASAVPAPLIKKASDLIASEEWGEIDQKLRKLLFSLQRGNSLKSFGTCKTCRHNQKIEDGFFCKLTQEPLSQEDTLKLCREHEFPTRSR